MLGAVVGDAQCLSGWIVECWMSGASDASDGSLVVDVVFFCFVHWMPRVPRKSKNKKEQHSV